MSAAGRWSYDRVVRKDRKGNRWHFVHHDVESPSLLYEERPVEIYFRDDGRLHFGRVRFERKKEFPYRNFEALAAKIMNNTKFRQCHLNSDTRAIWRRNWK